jgi:hypothetical protein
MKRLLATSAILAALAVPANAAIIQAFGTDPTSATGAIQHSLGASTSFFDDQYTFFLDHTMTLTIASITNVFPGGTSSTDFISGFTGSVFAGTPGSPTGQPIGPVLATQPCGVITNCQGFAGSAILGPGAYFLDISGTPGGTSGYGGNLATFALAETPLPGALPFFAAGLVGLVALVRKRRTNKVA